MCKKCSKIGRMKRKYSKGMPSGMTVVEVGAGYVGSQLVVNQAAPLLSSLPVVGSVVASQYGGAAIKALAGYATMQVSKGKTAKNLALGMFTAAAVDVVGSLLPASVTQAIARPNTLRIGAIPRSEYMARTAVANARKQEQLAVV